MAKAVGSEIVDFYQNGWPKGYYCDESELDVTDDGKIVRTTDPDSAESMSLTERYELSLFGMIISEQGGDYRDFAYFFNKWKKEKMTTTLLVEVSKDQEQSVRNLLAGAGVKIK